MKKVLCRILAALLALLPCCGVAEGSFYELNKDEIDAISSSIESFLSDPGSGMHCSVSCDMSANDFATCFVDIETNNGTYRDIATFYGATGRKGVEQLFFSFDFDSYVLRDDDYIVELLMLPYWGLAYLDMKTGKSVADSEVEKAWSVIMGYVFGEDMHSNYFYEYDKQHWVGVKFFQPSNETDPYTGALYCHVNLK